MKNDLLSPRGLWRPASVLALHLCLAYPLSGMATATAVRTQIVLDRKISFKAESQTIEAVLDQLEKQLNIKFVYSPTLIGANRRVTLQVADKPLTQVLDELLAPRKIAYEVHHNRVILSQAKPTSAAANVPVSGRVTQASGEGLPGVTVLVKGTTTGTSTGPDGSFSLNVPEGSTLVFSSVGFKSQERAVTGATSGLVISLVDDAQSLKEIVVVGYGTQERQSVTGAVASVSGRAIASQPVPDAAQAIQGRAAGVQVVSNSGAPGGAGGTSIRVRGITSAGDNTPLYVVDGYPLPSGDDTTLNTISPNDIESIDVLKDASSTAIYGLRAANGVVIITTKRGKAGTATVNADGYVGQQRVWRQIPLLNAAQFATLNNEARTNGGLIPIAKYANPAALGTGTDWLNEIFRPARIQNYNVSATGGSEKARYAVSAGYFQQDGTIINSNFTRFTLRANGDVALSKNFRIGNTLALTHLEEHQNNNNNNEFSGVIQLALQAPPTAPVYNADGSFYEFTSADNYGEENPVTAALRPRLKHTRNRATATFFAEFEPLKGLRFRTNVGTDLIFDQSDNFFPSIVGSSKYPVSQASLTSTSAYNPSYLIENTATYSHTFAEKHSLTVLVGQSAQQFNYSTLGGTRVGYSNNLQVLNQGPVNALISNTGDNGTNRLSSYFSRINYEFAGKYLFSAIARYDGSSAFDIDNKFGFFPGVSAGWRISEEDFLKDNTTISNLKLRGGYGKVGNPNNAGNYQYLTTINSNNFLTNGVPGTSYVFGSGSQNLNTGGAPTRLGSPNLRWENNEQVNVGIDVGLFQDRINASIDLYTRSSPNLIASVPPPTTSGTIENNVINAASSRNRGIDLAITTNNFVSSGTGFTWTTTLNFSMYRNKLVSLGEGKPYFGQGTRGGGNLVRYAEGVPFGSFYGYVADGIFQTADEVTKSAVQVAGTDPTKSTAPGDIKYKDLNGDGIINANDQAYIGNPNPDFTYGLNNTFTLKGFDLNVFLQGSQGNDVYNLNRYYTEGGLYGASNASTLTLDRWTGPGTSNYVPRAVAGDPNQNLRISSHYVENGSYMRIKLLTLGYTIPQTVFSKVPAVQRVRIYVSAQNLVTFTKYKGFDPELGNQGGSFGVDRGVYPQARVLLAGLNVGF
ncbi:SusC/RagA family TonB-linked outer membrane protein [Hymenobacter sp. HMF4947]|uniref:SusC/RagA family TonB-linked outer membrane protein n=1 Tax=Hymenobacter ginkgonis TaxID=2682976 RepID=A0A7K1TIE9_9BACT|nr:TonB-dependent receptor [Hymenobacter ginkgonis]MVN78152.1 SusC/RagA family TonB-linked outer membrane protein [Hymenobacter ginkgonis]